MSQVYMFLAALLGGLSVAMGAFGAHSMKGIYSEYALEVFEKAVRYEMYHALALFGVAILMRFLPGVKLLGISAAFFTAGIIFFSGSLYLIAFTGTRAFGMITPIGGVSFLIGWVLLAVAALRITDP